MTWFDVLLYGPGWIALLLLILGKVNDRRFERDWQDMKEHGAPYVPTQDSTGWKWRCHLCPHADAGYLTRWGASRVQVRHLRCSHWRGAASTPERPKATVS